MQEYCDKVLDALEYIGYPDYVECFEVEDIAESLRKSMAIFYAAGISPMRAACNIFGLTMTYQVIPDSSRTIKH